jgi:hypothetical protein
MKKIILIFSVFTLMAIVEIAASKDKILSERARWLIIKAINMLTGGILVAILWPQD